MCSIHIHAPTSVPFVDGFLWKELNLELNIYMEKTPVCTHCVKLISIAL